jgi:uncharacterized protein
MPRISRRVVRLGLFAVTLLTVLVSATLFWLCYQQAQSLAYPISLPAQYTPADFGMPTWRAVSFEADDGVRLGGWFVPPSDARGAAVLFVHGIGGNREQTILQARLLAQNGYGALLFDLRACGTSEGAVASMGYWESLDVQAAFTFLAAQSEVNPQRIAIYGASMGGAAAVRAMTQLPDARALIVESTFASLVSVVGDGVRIRTGLPASPFAELIVWLTGRAADANLFTVNSEADIAQIHVPLLVMHGAADMLIPVAHGERLYAAANEPKELWVVPNAGHGGLIYVDPTGFAAHVLPFLAQALG